MATGDPLPAALLLHRAASASADPLDIKRVAPHPAHRMETAQGAPDCADPLESTPEGFRSSGP